VSVAEPHAYTAHRHLLTAALNALTTAGERSRNHAGSPGHGIPPREPWSHETKAHGQWKNPGISRSRVSPIVPAYWDPRDPVTLKAERGLSES